MKPPYYKLKYRNMEPPGGFVFKDEDTGLWIQSLKTLGDLVQECINHRRINKLPIPEHFAEQIETFLCFRVDPTLVLDMPEQDRSKEILTIFKVNKYTTEFLQTWKKNGLKFVPIEEATTRAATCVNCEFNAKQICWTCKGSDQWIRGWTGRKTKHDKQLGVCKFDAILLFASIHANHPTLVMKEFKNPFPDFCWKKPKEK